LPATRGDLFSYQDPPTIATVSPVDGPVAGGTTVTITGMGFVAGATTVTLGGQALAGTATISVDGTTITGLSTPGALVAGAVPLVIATAAGQATRAAAFRYLAVPDATAVSPAKGPLAGRAVTISGSGFLSSATQVAVDGTPLAPGAFTVQSDTTIAATLPARMAAGSVAVVVTTPGGMDATAGTFTYQAAPTVASIAPNEGLATGGTSVTITGTGFDPDAGATTVTVGGAPLAGTLTVSMDGTTIAGGMTPPGTAGPAAVAVTTAGGTGTLAGGGANGFTYVEALSVASISPNLFALAGHTDESYVVAGSFRGVATLAVGAASTTVEATLLSPLGGNGQDTFIARYRAGELSNPLASARVVSSGPSDGEEALAAAMLPDRSVVVGGGVVTGTTFAPGGANEIAVPLGGGAFANALPHFFAARFFPDED